MEQGEASRTTLACDPACDPLVGAASWPYPYSEGVRSAGRISRAAGPASFAKFELVLDAPDWFSLRRVPEYGRARALAVHGARNAVRR